MIQEIQYIEQTPIFQSSDKSNYVNSNIEDYNASCKKMREFQVGIKKMMSLIDV